MFEYENKIKEIRGKINHTPWLYVLLLAVIILLVPSCSTHRKVEKHGHKQELKGTNVVENLIDSRCPWNTMSVKMSVRLNQKGKKPKKVGAGLKIKRDELIQLSVTPMLGVEVARLEISKMGILLVNRINKEYVEVPFSELKHIANLDYDMMQSLFLNEIFIPGKKTMSVADAKQFVTVEDGNQIVVKKKEKREKINYTFYVNADSHQLQMTRMVVKGTQYGLKWGYSDFEEINHRSYPRNMTILLEGILKGMSLNLDLNHVQVDQKWMARPFSTSKYRKIELEELLKMFGMINKR